MLLGLVNSRRMGGDGLHHLIGIPTAQSILNDRLFHH